MEKFIITKYYQHEYDISSESNSDCEIILHLYKKLGIYQTIRLLDGVFAFALVDCNKQTVYIARDTNGSSTTIYFI